MSTVQSPAIFRFPKAASLGDVEHKIREINSLNADGEVRAFVASKYSSDVLADIWSALAVGTLFRKNHRGTGVVWGINRERFFDPRHFALTPPGLVTAALANEVVREGAALPENMAAIRDWIRSVHKGYLGQDAGVRGMERWVIEFDDSRALYLSEISSRNDRLDRQTFDQLVVSIRKELEWWWEREKQTGSDVSTQEYAAARPHLAGFIKELFENTYQHGRRSAEQGRYVPNLRFMRFRKIAGPIEELKRRRLGGDVAIVREFVSAALAKQREPAFLEISISDFGYGIVDKFLSTPAGKKHQERPRVQVFEELLYENLTSNSLDPAAGHGIFDALHAARNLGALVSIRTNEFWRAQNFAAKTNGITLHDVATTPLGMVAGTHWQFIWAPPPL